MSKMGRMPVFWLFFLVLMSPALSGAQSPQQGTPGRESEAPQATAPVTLDGKTLFRVRGVTAYPAETRAKAISERIKALARDPSFSPQTLRVVEKDEMAMVQAGDREVFAVVNADSRPEGVERSILPQLYLSNVTEAITRYRRDRAPEVLLNRTLYAFGATALFVAFLLGLRWAFRRFDAWVERAMKATLQRLEAASRKGLKAEQIWGALRRGLHTLYVLLVLLSAYQYAQFVLGLYPWTRWLSERMFSLFFDPLSAMGKAFTESIPDLAFLTVLAVVTRILLRAIRRFFVESAQGTVTMTGFEAEWALPTYKILRLFVVAFAVVIAYPYIPGSSSAAFKGVSLFLGVMMSLGSTSLISNILAGYTLIYRRAFRLGDRIQVDSHTGDVMEIRNMVTHLRTPKNEEVVLPNSTILNSHVVNYSALAKKQGLILHTTVGIGYETPWRQVEAMLLAAAERTPGLLLEPLPFVHLKSLGSFDVTYELNVCCNDPAAMAKLYSALHKNILDVFNEYGIQIMTPAYRADTEQPKIVPREQWFAPPAKEPPDTKSVR
ncbi:MAG: mechanosensitive ion channel family protein [Deltaproteobacteria bacterium]|nr:MAG: mechanosensitive ion channel family protein [Deltaproteobacteria bacterium]